MIPNHFLYAYIKIRFISKRTKGNFGLKGIMKAMGESLATLVLKLQQKHEGT
jgi:hypothetical protein